MQRCAPLEVTGRFCTTRIECSAVPLAPAGRGQIETLRAAGFSDNAPETTETIGVLDILHQLAQAERAPRPAGLIGGDDITSDASAALLFPPEACLTVDELDRRDAMFDLLEARIALTNRDFRLFLEEIVAPSVALPIQTRPIHARRSQGPEVRAS